MNDKSGVWGAASSGESPGRREMLLLRLVVMAHLTENPLLLMSITSSGTFGRHSRFKLTLTPYGVMIILYGSTTNYENSIYSSARMVWRPDTPATACVVRRINGVGTLLPMNVEFSTPTVTPLRLNAHCNPAASQHQLSGECVLNAVVNHEGFSVSKSIKINSQR